MKSPRSVASPRVAESAGWGYFFPPSSNIKKDTLYLYHHAKSIELIQYNASRGMSRKAMAKIWPYRLLNLVLGYEEAK
jgi:hypothetical protein